HREAVQRFSSRVRDVHEFLASLGPVAPKGALPIRAVYHDACHLAHAQQIRSQPRELLRMIPGLELVPLEESEICCGAAGSYNITEPELSDRLARRKVDHIVSTGASALFVGNAGCTLHIARALRDQDKSLWIAHPIEALDLSYRNEAVPAQA